jgi:hypothetical protein
MEALDDIMNQKIARLSESEVIIVNDKKVHRTDYQVSKQLKNEPEGN